MEGHTDVNFPETSREGNVELLKRYSKKEANKFDVDGMTPTHWAAFYGKIDALRILVEKGGNPDKPNSEGSTAVHLAAGAGHLHCLKFLTNFGSNVYSVNDNGDTPMQEAVNKGKLECVRHIEALVTHQVSQDKAKVEKMQNNAKREAEKRIKEKSKLLLKLDRDYDKKVIKQRKLIGASMDGLFMMDSGSNENHLVNGSNKNDQILPYSRVARLPHSDGDSYEFESQASIFDDDSNSGSYKRIEKNTSFENSSSSDELAFNRDLHRIGKSDNISISSESSNTLQQPEKNIPHPSKSESLVASLRSLHPDGSFIASGPFTNVKLQSIQGPVLTIKNGKLLNSSFDEPMENSNIPNSLHQSARIQTVGNVPPSKRIGKPVGIVDISMGPLYTLLHSLQLDEYRDVFHREKIDLRACVLCNENDLREIGLPLGPRKKLLDATSKRNRTLQHSNEMLDSAV